MYSLQKVDDSIFEIYHAVYAEENLFLHYDWNQLLENFSPAGNGYFLLRDHEPIGGAAIHGGKITAPFLIAPFDNHAEFIKQLLQIAAIDCQQIELAYIPEAFDHVLRELQACKIRCKSQMIRPTASFHSELPAGL